jgi:hypothetical protein
VSAHVDLCCRVALGALRLVLALSDWGHWKNPVIYMSRATTREVWLLLYGTEPDLHGDLRYGQSQIPVLFDDRMELGVARLEEFPES